MEIDFFEEVTNIDKVKEALSKLKGVISDKPIVFTFRSFEEGGERKLMRILF